MRRVHKSVIFLEGTRQIIYFSSQVHHNNIHRKETTPTIQVTIHKPFIYHILPNNKKDGARQCSQHGKKNLIWVFVYTSRRIFFFDMHLDF